MAKNSFKELENLLCEDKEFTFEKVKNNLVGTRSMFGFLGDIIHHFLPGILDVFIGFSGGRERNTDSRYPHEGGQRST